MAETESFAMVPEDLEDGEIESDCEETIKEEIKETVDDNKQEISPLKEEPIKINDDTLDDDIYYSRSGKKKKSKNKDYKFKDKNRKYSKRANTPEDDFAGSIEKAIRKVLNKDEKEPEQHEEGESRRKRKKRKKNDGKEGAGKKKKKDYADDVDENEMMCVRGASPVQRQPQSPEPNSYDEESYASESSADSRDQHSRQRHRTHRKNKSERDRDRERRRGNHMQDVDGICAYFMQGKCHKGDDCIYSHDANPPRKMELCKFYLMDCCAKRDKCLYMHSDFPCKFYHTGLPCINKDDCKFAHGKPLTEALKTILIKHLESAPKEILGDFPRLSKEGAIAMICNTQAKLKQQYNIEGNENQEKTIPSLFELNIPKPPNLLDSNMNNDKHHKMSNKVRQSRWQNEDNMTHSPNSNGAPINVLSLKNLNGVLTPKQISDLTHMGIENLDQLGQLTVLQLNSIGISLKQITEIQLNTMNIQKLGLISSNSETLSTPAFVTSIAGSKDLDLRVPPVVPTTTPVISESSGKDIDMRFHSSIMKSNNGSAPNTRPQINKDMIDIDQYTKDALKFVTKDSAIVEDTTEINNTNDTFNINAKKAVDPQTKDVDQRVLQFSEDTSDIYKIDTTIGTDKKETDTDIRFLQPGPLFKNTNKSYRPSTTDDEDNNLLIDEKWYSSDEDKPLKHKSNSCSPVPMSPKTINTVQNKHVEPEAVLSKLGDLSQFAISDEVTKLLNTMKNNLHDTNSVENDVVKSPSSRDPRNSVKKSPERKNNEANKISNKKTPRISIYECIEGEPTDGRRRSDVDLRHSDYKLPAFGDTDLRPNPSGDVDFRLSLPFKPIPNYTPASEIDGSINSHPPIPYKVVTIDIPRPDYTDIRNSTPKSQAILDPRLRKVFRLSIDEPTSDSEKSTKQVAPRVDPRRKQKEEQEHKPSLELQTILQNSDWYKELSSTQKIYVNQNLALVTSMIKQHQQDKSTNKKFDVGPVQSNPNLVSIFNNLGVSLNDNAEFVYLPKPKEGLLKTPVIQNPNFGMGNANMDNMNVMNMPHMNMGGMNMGPMPGFNHPMVDPRGPPTPGLLGIAPNIPHNFDNNFNGHNFPGMPFNGNDFGNMDFPRFPNRGGFRGRGNDRWNRGGGHRGHRDRKGYDRGGWKGGK